MTEKLYRVPEGTDVPHTETPDNRRETRSTRAQRRPNETAGRPEIQITPLPRSRDILPVIRTGVAVGAKSYLSSSGMLIKAKNKMIMTLYKKKYDKFIIILVECWLKQNDC